MTLSLGVDTGGTFTDAVLIRDEETVVASAKSLTTRHDLAVGIGKAVEQVIRDANADPSDIKLASLSTTLATNALIEGQGEAVGLVLIGFAERDLEKHGLTVAMAGDPVLVIEGGHNHAGAQAAPLDEHALLAWLQTFGRDVSAFAVAAQFATRNTEHEKRALDLIKEHTGKPVSCSHHLSSKLNGPKRAITAVLNARLIGMINRLITRAAAQLESFGITAPLMVVRGDGALISAEFALERPIETILSGPAASIVGARWLTGASDALVSDIGGTTTDVAMLRDGRPTIDPAGARVGPYRTMVEAVAMRTVGLGGDSETHFVSEGLTGGITLGPKRVLPISLLAHEAPDVVLPLLDAQLRQETPPDHIARFVRAVPNLRPAGLDEKDAEMLDRIGQETHPFGRILRNRREQAALRRLTHRGLVQVSGITPSDASHVLGLAQSWDADAAGMALEIFARQRTGSGVRLADGRQMMARMIVDRLTHQTALVLLEAAFAEDGRDFGTLPAELAAHVLTQAGLDRHEGIIKLHAALNTPVIGLGASAPTYYPAVGARLGCPTELPEHAGVANAIGAVVGRVTIRCSGNITSPSEGLFRVHFDTGPQDFRSSEAAIAALERVLTETARTQAQSTGAEGIQLETFRDIRTAKVEAKDVFVEADIRVEASGRPRIADGG